MLLSIKLHDLAALRLAKVLGEKHSLEKIRRKRFESELARTDPFE
jgi:hypothetical protein